MTIQEALARIDETRPGEVDINTLVKWLSDLDGQIYEEVLKIHEGMEDVPHGPYPPFIVTDGNGDDPPAPPPTDAILLVPEPYSELYIFYLMMNIDYSNAEYDRYNSEASRFNAAMSTYENWINRNHMPKQNGYVRY